MNRTIYHAVKAIQAGEVEKRGHRHYFRDEDESEICLEEIADRLTPITGIRRENLLRDGFVIPYFMRSSVAQRIDEYEAHVAAGGQIMDLDEHFAAAVERRRAHLEGLAEKRRSHLVATSRVLQGREGYSWQKSIEGNFVVHELWLGGRKLGAGVTSEEAVQDAEQTLVNGIPAWQRSFDQYCASVVVLPVVRERARGDRVVVDNSVFRDNSALSKTLGALKRFLGDEGKANQALSSMLSHGLNDCHLMTWTFDPDERGPVVLAHWSSVELPKSILRDTWSHGVREALAANREVPEAVIREAGLAPVDGPGMGLSKLRAAKSPSL